MRRLIVALMAAILALAVAAPAEAFFTIARSGHVGRMLEMPVGDLQFQECWGGYGNNTVAAGGIRATRTTAYPNRVQVIKDTVTLAYANSSGGWTPYGGNGHSRRRVRPGHVAHFYGYTWDHLPVNRYWTVVHRIRWFVGGTLRGWRDYALHERDVVMGNSYGTTGGDPTGWCYLYVP
jgi:hypothetical protein